MFQDPQFQKLFKAVGTLLVVLLVFLSLSVIWDVFAKWGFTSTTGEENTLTVSASGKTTITTDTARFSASVVTRGDNPETVQQQNTEATNRVVDYLRGQGLAEDDIKTVGYNLYPTYDYTNGRQIPTGYTLEQTVQVKTEELEKVGALLSGIVNAGANQVHSVEFFVDDPDEFRSSARDEAIAKAREKAENIANETGSRLGKLLSFTESGGDTPPIFYGRALGLGGAAEDAAVPNVASGSQELTVSVTVTYELK